MGKGTKVVAHEGTGTRMGIFYKCGYGEGHCSTLPIGYPLSSLVFLHPLSLYYGMETNCLSSNLLMAFVKGIHSLLIFSFFAWRNSLWLLLMQSIKGFGIQFTSQMSGLNCHISSLQMTFFSSPKLKALNFVLWLIYLKVSARLQA
jgi:hypothetical protein